MTTLADRIEGLDNASRAIDAEIAAHLKIYTGQFDYARKWQGAWEHEINGMVHLINDKGQRSLNFISPRYTGSIDAAMTLVPDGWRWEVMNFYVDVEYTRSVCPKTGKADECFSVSDGAHAYLERPKETFDNCDDWRWNGNWTGIREVRTASAPTPALALCAAAIRARAG